MRCETCKGSGDLLIDGHQFWCPDCHGTGGDPEAAQLALTAEERARVKERFAWLNEKLRDPDPDETLSDKPIGYRPTAKAFLWYSIQTINKLSSTLASYRIEHWTGEM